MTRIVIAVPCYNEETRLDLPAFERALDSWRGLRFVFVDDGSSDGTAEVLASFREGREDRVDVESLAENRGKAEAVRRGCLRALASEPDLIGYWDADLATPLSEIGHFLEVFERRPDVRFVLGSRVKLMGRTVVRSTARHYAGRVFATVASLVLSLPVYDTQCGSKMMVACAPLREVLSEPFLTRWIFDVELIARYLALEEEHFECGRGESIYELPLMTWIDRGDSRLGYRDFLRAPLELARIRGAYRETLAT